jgi:phospholipid/cholesterol/gamma-HCH transport system permease protein
MRFMRLLAFPRVAVVKDVRESGVHWRENLKLTPRDRISMLEAASLSVSRTPASAALISIGGDWRLSGATPPATTALSAILSLPVPVRVEFDCSALGQWDTTLLTLLVAIRRECERHGTDVVEEGLPEGARRLLNLAFAVKERKDARRESRHLRFIPHFGQATLQVWDSVLELLRFIGVSTQSLLRLLRGRAGYQRSDVVVAIQEAGAEALPIVGLISFLIGMIFAFVGVRQLEQFGAGIYVADLVAVAMVREMAPIMTAIIMAGRTGAAYAAHLGTMKVNEEIDALSSLGIDPIDFLVLPRFLALVVMLPLLTLYASLLGILGGALVSLTMLDVSFAQYMAQTEDSLGLGSVLGGLFKSLVYGSLVAVAGCQQGMASGSSALAVGQATTRAVVMGIVLIIVSAAVLTVIYITLDI